MALRKITPFLWFDTQAEDAAKFYTSIFPNSSIDKIARYPEGGMGPAGSVMTVEFVLEGQPFIALNGGPIYHFTEAISFVVDCETQDEVDDYWTKLTAGGTEIQCGWLKDKFGLTWQIVPSGMIELFNDPNPARSRAAMAAMMGMKKLDIGALRDAADKATV